MVNMVSKKGGGISIGENVDGSVIVEGENNTITIYHSYKEETAKIQETPKKKDIGPNPYVGLGTFLEKDKERFFGREDVIKKLWIRSRELNESKTNLNQIRILSVLGPSGSGKSSVVRAGLLNELVRSPIPECHNPKVAILKPGQKPLQQLANVLSKIITGDPAPAEKAREFANEFKVANENGEFDGLTRIAGFIPNISNSVLIIIVDQFEEVYTLCQDKIERNTFISNLLTAATDKVGTVSIILTLRSDFLLDTQKNQTLNHVIAEHGFIVPALNKEELYQAIAIPAINSGYQFDEALIEMLIEQTWNREGALPLLQFTLARIWEDLGKGITPMETIKKIGGIGGALAEEAQRL